MQQRLHVVQLLPALHSGGVEVTTLEIGKALVDAGHQSTVISDGGQMVETLLKQGSRHIGMNTGHKRPWTLLNSLRLAAWLRREQPDIVHVRSRLPAWVLEGALRLLPAHQRPIRVASLHGMNSVSRYSSILLRGVRVIAVSKATKRYWAQRYPQIDQSHVRVIEPGIDAEDFPHGYRPGAAWRQAFLERFPMLRQRRILCLPGRLSRLKGHQTFIDLLAALAAKRSDVAGLIVGGEEPGREAYARSLYQQVDERGLSDRIVFAGRRDDIRECLAMSDVVLSLSNKPETFGRTVLEALSLGRSVAGWDHGGVSDLLAELCPRGRVPLHDQRALLVTVLALLEHPAKGPSPHRFTLNNSCQRTLALYEDVLK